MPSQTVRSPRKPFEAQEAGTTFGFQRDLSKALMPSQTIERKKYRTTQTASYCSFRPMRHAASSDSTARAIEKIAPMPIHDSRIVPPRP